MATHAINKANSRLRFLYRQNKFLDIPLGRRHWEYCYILQQYIGWSPANETLLLYIFFSIYLDPEH